MTEDIEFWRNKARELEAERDAIQAKTIEECAKIVDPWPGLAERIRALAQTSPALTSSD
jgi:hypothetical protein